MDEMERFAETARLRGETMRNEKNNRFAQRSKRMESREKPYQRPRGDENDLECKLRSVFAAIRSFNNTDVELHTSMSASELFNAVTEALSSPSAQAATVESRSLGEALDLVSRLNSVLQTR